LLEPEVAEEMVAWDHSGGFSLDAGVRIEAEDRPGLERLLRYCARPVFALERLRQIDPEHLVYESLKPGPGGSVSLLLTQLELIASGVADSSAAPASASLLRRAGAECAAAGGGDGPSGG
jgi:hypothetical protein